MAATPSKGRAGSEVWLKAGVSCSLVFQVALTEGISFLGNGLHVNAFAEGMENDALPTLGCLADGYALSANAETFLRTRSAGPLFAQISKSSFRRPRAMRTKK
jgi:hypothetical protein